MSRSTARFGAAALASLTVLASGWLSGCGPPAAGTAPSAEAPVAAAPKKPAPAPPPDPPAEVADSTTAAPPVVADPEVAVELGVGKRIELAAQARKDVEAAEHLLASLGAPADTVRSEKLRTARSLLEQARRTLPEDPDAAATLAHKARLLAEEITALH